MFILDNNIIKQHVTTFARDDATRKAASATDVAGDGIGRMR